jgi:hypothetical protein
VPGPPIHTIVWPHARRPLPLPARCPIMPGAPQALPPKAPILMTLAEQIQLTSDYAAQAEQIKTAAIAIALSLCCIILLLIGGNSK